MVNMDTVRFMSWITKLSETIKKYGIVPFSKVDDSNLSAIIYDDSESECREDCHSKAYRIVLDKLIGTDMVHHDIISYMEDLFEGFTFRVVSGINDYHIEIKDSCDNVIIIESNGNWYFC